MILRAEGGIFNCAAQTFNHSFFWNSLSPNGGGEPSGPLADALNASFGDFESFKAEFSAVAGGHFGSGWAWLVANEDGSLAVVGTHDASNPVREGLGQPLLTVDVWEHAYYIDYRNDRGSYLSAVWNLVNWDFASSNYESCSSEGK